MSIQIRLFCQLGGEPFSILAVWNGTKKPHSSLFFLLLLLTSVEFSTSPIIFSSQLFTRVEFLCCGANQH
ncbi:unnamed protein product [Citrullus colocynthis]|uniref:Uncharacterized protein n=1 Tax=Citrullus colocynthis TaxID=252529 RepID=A0ABP0XTL2_9ROSI